MSNYNFNKTSKYVENDNKEIMSRRWFESLMEWIHSEMELQKSTFGVDNSTEESMAATLPPFEFRAAIDLCSNLLKDKTDEILAMMDNNLKEDKWKKIY